MGIRQKRSSEFDDMEENWESEEYDVVYELSLDEPLTIEQQENVVIAHQFV